jgi:hypothetical protein
MLLTIASITCLSCTSSSDEFGGFQLAGGWPTRGSQRLAHAVASRIRRSIRVKLPGDSERPGEIVECTAMGYALLFGGPPQRRTVALLRERGAIQ